MTNFNMKQMLVDAIIGAMAIAKVKKFEMLYILSVEYHQEYLSSLTIVQLESIYAQYNKGVGGERDDTQSQKQLTSV